MMQLSIVSVVAIAALAFSADGDEQLLLSKKDVLNAIAAFRADPLSDPGRLAAGIVAAYVKTSSDVMVRLTPKVFPIQAGSAGSQLKRNKIGDDPYAGDRQLIETYQLLQRRNPKLKVTGVEKLIELERSGRLKQYVSSP